MKNGETRTLKSGIEIIRDEDDYGYKRYTAIDPTGYIGRTRICENSNYNTVLGGIREYTQNNNLVTK